MWQLKEHVKQGCQMAEEILTPGSACHHALPLTIMEHSSISPDQAALWQAITQVCLGMPSGFGQSCVRLMALLPHSFRYTIITAIALRGQVVCGE